MTTDEDRERMTDLFSKDSFPEFPEFPEFPDEFGHHVQGKREMPSFRTGQWVRLRPGQHISRHPGVKPGTRGIVIGNGQDFQSLPEPYKSTVLVKFDGFKQADVVEVSGLEPL